MHLRMACISYKQVLDISDSGKLFIWDCAVVKVNEFAALWDSSLAL